MKRISLKLRLSLIFLIVYFSNPPIAYSATEPNAGGACSSRRESSGGYCGIYCLYAAMKYFGVTVEPNELVKPEYIGSFKGSSLAELKKAAQNYGLYAVAVSRLSTKDLRGVSLPVILHVKSSPTAKKYEHYELFLGSRQGEALRQSSGQALIYDPPNPPELADFWTLAPVWDGTGLLVSNNPINLNAVFASSRLRFAGLAGIAIAGVFAVRFSRRRFPGIQTITRKQSLILSFTQCAILVLVSVIVAFAYHFINDEGLIKRQQAVKAVQLAHQPTQNNVQKADNPK